MPNTPAEQEQPDSLTDYENMLKEALEADFPKEDECSAYSPGPSEEES